jgi:signal transduction histidine kinase/ActR/RegA family two-component response regulator
MIRSKVFGTLSVYSDQPDAFDFEELILLNELAGDLAYGLQALRVEAEHRLAQEALAASEEQVRQSQKMEAIGQLAGGVAHDFNNLLTAILGYSSMAQYALDEKHPIREYVGEIINAGERAASLTRQLLAFSRRQLMQPKLLDLNDIVTNLTKMLQRILGEHVPMHLKLHPLPLMTYSDAGMLDQVLLNLAVNARDAMPGGGELHIETTMKEITKTDIGTNGELAPGKYVCLRVSDTGCGIPVANIPRIFDPFFTTKEPGKGTGLGLATVFGIVKQHQGGIHVNSEVGKGSTFEVLIPASNESLSAATGSLNTELPRGTETILVVEDESVVRRLTRDILEEHGYEVLEAGDGVEALKVWEQHQSRVQLLLTDIVMPEGISGLDLAARLQVPRPDLKVIFTSGYSADLAGRELNLQEGQNFLAKPSRPHQILAAVRRCLDS